MKIGNLLVGVGILTVAGCAQVVVHPDMESSDLIPPLAVANTLPSQAPEPMVDASPAPQPEPTFAELAPTAWTLQIAAVKNLERIEQIEADNKLLNDTLHVPTHDPDLGDLHAVLVGVYPTQAEAAQTARNLPPNVAGDKPWVRTVASVQAVMR